MSLHAAAAIALVSAGISIAAIAPASADRGRFHGGEHRWGWQRDAVALINQGGSGLTITQNGNGNSANAVQFGGGGALNITQNGNNNSVTVLQVNRGGHGGRRFGRHGSD